ncbi:AdoMet_MTases domain containing protein [Rhabdaerophilaceae bacterium]
MRPSKLLTLLSLPGTDAAPKLVVTEQAGEEPFNGWFENESGEIVGRLEAFRPAFVNFAPVTDSERAAAKEGAQPALRPRVTFTSCRDPRVEWSGQPIELEDYLKGFNGDERGIAARFSSRAPQIEVGLYAHAWSGLAEVYANGALVATVDLFNRENGVLRRVSVFNPTQSNVLIEVQPAGKKAPEAFYTQVLLEGFFEYSAELEIPSYRKSQNINRGGAFHSRFYEILASLPPDAVVIDVGGGKRQIADERYINLEYSRFEEPDLFGDGTKLPFRSNSVDFVYTAAVLEHVTDPLAMGREIFRILKPGGLVLANSAFMQPIHSEGQHFFNLTPYGIDLTFKDFANRRVWWDTGFEFTMQWFVDVLSVRGRLPQEKLDQFINLAKEISAAIPEDRGMYVASSVWVEGTKP